MADRINLFLLDDIPREMSWADFVAAMRLSIPIPTFNENDNDKFLRTASWRIKYWTKMLEANEADHVSRLNLGEPVHRFYEENKKCIDIARLYAKKTINATAKIESIENLLVNLGKSLQHLSSNNERRQYIENTIEFTQALKDATTNHRHLCQKAEQQYTACLDLLRGPNFNMNKIGSCTDLTADVSYDVGRANERIDELTRVLNERNIHLGASETIHIGGTKRRRSRKYKNKTRVSRKHYCARI